MAAESTSNGEQARTNDRMIGPPRSLEMASFVVISEAKGQASTEGFCRASARHRWRVDLATPSRLAPSRTEIPFLQMRTENLEHLVTRKSLGKSLTAYGFFAGLKRHHDACHELRRRFRSRK
jgi:hypothetical protein